MNILVACEESQRVCKAFRDSLKDLRKQTKKTLAEVAKVLNVTVNAISNYENGIRRINIEQVLLLAKLYDVTAEEIIVAQLNSQFVR